MDDSAADEDFEELFPGMSTLAYERQPGLCDVGTPRAELGPVLAGLPDRQRQVLSLRYLAGLDDIGISEALGISMKAVRKHAARGNAALRARRGGIADASLLLG
ncbi:MAG TPA: sigma factor-like helix-turn-helix DNA-binding protein [Acidimicrobiales bacterium]|jgi:DNA-directed RNA polymerase specialized sigma24 family protein|nr:sigma factor-like helix-turn-helix DNA-binding protein [Acidimicrobiales bacterium]HWI05294.1 sigma factor-like helix-turn-helix DNA-binding protein [Acidimicrobiales bacterium]